LKRFSIYTHFLRASKKYFWGAANVLKRIGGFLG
jgi:hypothetical protein